MPIDYYHFKVSLFSHDTILKFVLSFIYIVSPLPLLVFWVYFSNFFFLFRATPTAYGGSQARGRIGATAAAYATATATLGIQAVSVIYTTAHGNAGSLTHGGRPGIEPTSSWILVRFLNG